MCGVWARVCVGVCAGVCFFFFLGGSLIFDFLVFS